MSKEIELDTGEVLEVTGVIEAMEMLGCSADDLDYWLDHGWLRQHCCASCGTTWPLLDDVITAAHLAERNPHAGLYEIVHKLHIENSREARQRQLVRRTASLQPRQIDPESNPGQRSYGRRTPNTPYTTEDQETILVEPTRGGPKRARRLHPEELETRTYTAFEVEIPEEYEDRPRNKVLPQQPERRGLFRRR